jgi:hypothetical protein
MGTTKMMKYVYWYVLVLGTRMVLVWYASICIPKMYRRSENILKCFDFLLYLVDSLIFDENSGHIDKKSKSPKHDNSNSSKRIIFLIFYINVVLP